MPLSVSALTQQIKSLLEQGLASVRVLGEVSRLSTPASGHVYFTIKDPKATLAAVLWKSTAARLKHRLREGEAYVFHGAINVYPPRGSYQLIVHRIEAVGEGALAAAFEERKQRLASLGLFDAQNKKPIPQYPVHIGLITSASSAAFADVQKVLNSRPRWLQCTLIDTPVQGDQAAKRMISALQNLCKHKPCPDVLLLVRGGGSIEDLWCFNNEELIHAMVACPIPIITGIGHEIDTTLADMVADLRAATPSNAAELLCPSRQHLHSLLPSWPQLAEQQKQRHQRQRKQCQDHIKHATHALKRAFDAKHMHCLMLDRSLQQWVLRSLHEQKQKHLKQAQSLQEHAPRVKIKQQKQARNHLEKGLHFYTQKRLQEAHKEQQDMHYQLYQSIRSLLQKRRQQQQQQALRLEALNPTAVMKRGFLLARHATGTLIHSAQQLRPGDAIQLHFHDGVQHAHIDTKDDQDDSL